MPACWTASPQNPAVTCGSPFAARMSTSMRSAGCVADHTLANRLILHDLATVICRHAEGIHDPVLVQAARRRRFGTSGFRQGEAKRIHRVAVAHQPLRRHHGPRTDRLDWGGMGEGVHGRFRTGGPHDQGRGQGRGQWRRQGRHQVGRCASTLNGLRTTCAENHRQGHQSPPPRAHNEKSIPQCQDSLNACLGI